MLHKRPHSAKHGVTALAAQPISTNMTTTITAAANNNNNNTRSPPVKQRHNSMRMQNAKRDTPALQPSPPQPLPPSSKTPFTTDEEFRK